MTDITELAQRMKTAAEKLDADQWQTRKGFSGIEGIVKGSLEKGHGCVCFQPVAADMADTKTARSIALVSPANVLALGEALEKAQTINAAAEKLVRCKGRYHSEQNYRALAALFGVNTPDLPPLDDESHAVTVENLQESAYRAGLTAGWNLGLANNNEGFNKCLAAHTAGFKVKAE